MIRGRRLSGWLIALAALLLMSTSVLALLPTRFGSTSFAPRQAGAEVSVAVSSSGCTPSNATRATGQVSLKVLNQTGEADLTVQLYDGRGVLLRDVSFTQGQTEWSETFDLPAGNYTLKVVDHPQCTFSLTVQ